MTVGALGIILHCVSVLLEQPNTMNGIVEGVTGNTVWAGITRFRQLFGNRIKITSPGFRETLSGGEQVGDTVRYKVHGTLKHLPKNHRIWLLTEDDANGRVWPQGFETVEYDISTGTWGGRISVMPGTGKLKINVVMAPLTSQELFHYFQQVGVLRNRTFEPIKRIPIECKIRDSVPVIVP